MMAGFVEYHGIVNLKAECQVLIGWHCAAQATLEEVKEADLLIHVLDASSRNVANQRRAVLNVLRELGISEHRLSNRTLEVWNKMDLVEESSNVTTSGGSCQSPEDLRDFPGYEDQFPEYEVNEQSSEGSESRSPAESASNLAAASAPYGDPNLLEEAENMHSIWDQIQVQLFKILGYRMLQMLYNESQLAVLARILKFQQSNCFVIISFENALHV